MVFVSLSVPNGTGIIIQPDFSTVTILDDDEGVC